MLSEKSLEIALIFQISLECATQTCNALNGVGEKKKENTTVHAEPEV